MRGKIEDLDLDKILELDDIKNNKIEKKEPSKPIEKKDDQLISPKELARLNESSIQTPLKCIECGFFNSIKDKCNFAKAKKCQCNKPEFLAHYRNYEDIGFCKNCRHLIIRIKDKTWNHYSRPYHCKIPYNQLECVYPQSFELEVQELILESKIEEKN